MSVVLTRTMHVLFIKPGLLSCCQELIVALQSLDSRIISQIDKSTSRVNGSYPLRVHFMKNWLLKVAPMAPKTTAVFIRVKHGRLTGDLSNLIPCGADQSQKILAVLPQTKILRWSMAEIPV